MKILTNAEQIVTCNTNGKNFKSGKELSELEVLTSHSIVIENDLIKDILPTQSIKNFSKYEIVDLRNKIILPGLVECHTHTAFAGSRADEFKMKLDGIHYEEIAAKGGGILKTVNAVREISLTEFVELIKPRIEDFISQGITTLEIKSGYGLDFENEIKILHAIKILDEIYPIDIVPTFLGAHTYPKEFRDNHEEYINELVNKMIPHIAKNNLAEFCDAFCETSAFSADEVDLIFSAAAQHGLKLKLHTEQFNSIGGLDVALKHKAISVDHLEVLKPEDISRLASSDIVCDLLPGVSFFLNHHFAPARELIDSGAVVALSTDYNPGSSHILDLHLIMQIAALKMQMRIEEIINAVTINAAKSLTRNDSVGSIEIGKKADFSVFNTIEYSDIIYSVGRNLNCMTIKNGEVIYSRV